jgi:hypothetical protein
MNKWKKGDQVVFENRAGEVVETDWLRVRFDGTTVSVRGSEVLPLDKMSEIVTISMERSVAEAMGRWVMGTSIDYEASVKAAKACRTAVGWA